MKILFGNFFLMVNILYLDVMLLINALGPVIHQLSDEDSANIQKAS